MQKADNKNKLFCNSKKKLVKTNMAKGEDMELQQFNGNCQAGPDAVLLLGSTGTGKSSTINKCTGQSIKIGDGYKPVTTHCDSYP